MPLIMSMMSAIDAAKPMTMKVSAVMYDSIQLNPEPGMGAVGWLVLKNGLQFLGIVREAGADAWAFAVAMKISMTRIMEVIIAFFALLLNLFTQENALRN